MKEGEFLYRIEFYADSAIRLAALYHNRRMIHCLSEAVEHQNNGQVGSFYVAKVCELVPSLDAMFLDAGLKNRLFIKIDDMELPLPVMNQYVLVQLIHEPQMNKGARATMKYSLSGTYLIFMPHSDQINISRKITDEESKQRLLQMARNLSRNDEGWIIRTGSDGVGMLEFEEEMNSLRTEWEHIQEFFRERCHDSNVSTNSAIGFIERQTPFWKRALVFYHQWEITEMCLIVNQEEQIRSFEKQWVDFEGWTIDKINKISRDEHQFYQKNIRDQLSKWTKTKIWLPSGGYVLVEVTQTLTVIDVNSGKSIHHKNFTQTARSTNLEACKTIMQLIRLRDIGGIILIDFINMENQEELALIIDEIKRYIYEDSQKVMIAGWTNLGLLELTRKRAGNAHITNWLNSAD
jgi:ribonuclease G